METISSFVYLSEHLFENTHKMERISSGKKVCFFTSSSLLLVRRMEFSVFVLGPLSQNVIRRSKKPPRAAVAAAIYLAKAVLFISLFREV
jgi:hypothetical protein